MPGEAADLKKQPKHGDRPGDQGPAPHDRQSQSERRHAGEHHARSGGHLHRLQTDYIDLYQVHGWDSNTPLEETVRTLDDVVRHGKVRYIGLSNYLSWQAATAVMLHPAGTRFAEAGSFVPFDRDMGYRVVDTLKRFPAGLNRIPNALKM
jgi:aryl-alcohol dehydrogenase-like predicted oxidoreductase